MHPILALVVALFIFTLGLLAWRQQLLDKRKFEVAEDALVMFARMSAQIRLLRNPHSYDGMREFITVEKGFSIKDVNEYYLGFREWRYRIPEKKAEAFAEVHKEYPATIALARIYLPEIVSPLLTLEAIQWRVHRAAEVLPKLLPKHPSDLDTKALPNDLESRPGDDELDKKHFSDRFEEDPHDADAINTEMWEAEAQLEAACRPHTNQNPYRFLQRFIYTLKPTLLIDYMRSRPRDS